MITDEEKILVLIQLIGGNDGLNTIIPLNSYDNLIKFRKQILIPEKEWIHSNNNIAFHPSASFLNSLFNENQLSIVNNVGYDSQNRSHFRSMDIWNSGSPANEQWPSGWLGRFLDIYHNTFPTDYPTLKYPDPLAVSLGNIVSDTCQGKLNNFSYVVDNLSNFSKIENCDVYPIENMSFLNTLTFLNSSINLTNQYTKRIELAATKGSNIVSYPDNTFAQELKVVSKLISGGLKTRIYVLNLGGFDTHAYQADPSDPKTGMHAFHLKTLTDGLNAFVEDLKKLKNFNKTTIMTYSEFGRQIISNSAYGTDHGDAAPCFIISENIQNSLIGDLPKIPSEIEAHQGVDMKIDFRDVYSSVLKKVFDASAIDIENVFGRAVQQDFTI